MTAAPETDTPYGAGEAHRYEDTDFHSADFRRPFGVADPTAVTAIINAHYGDSGLPERDWTLLAPIRPGEAVANRLVWTIDPALMLRVLEFFARAADIRPTRSGKQWRARLRRREVS